ncbi:MAG: hypothetical protein M1438_19920, partial [Deltaproteobacteria bacterium]|nr:hypothetical protein [Deltaproteobacteria bacterium]
MFPLFPLFPLKLRRYKKKGGRSRLYPLPKAFITPLLSLTHLHPSSANLGINCPYWALDFLQRKHYRGAANRIIQTVPIGDGINPNFAADCTFKEAIMGIGKNYYSPSLAKDAMGLGKN